MPKKGETKPKVAKDAGAAVANPKKRGARKPKAEAVVTEVGATEETVSEVVTTPPEFVLANGKRVDFAAVRKAIGIYSPSASIPEDDGEALALLREVVAARLAEVPSDDHMLCGEQDDVTTGCREMATGDVLFCPYCGDEGVPEDEAPPSPEAQIAEVLSPTEAGLVAMKSELDEATSRFNQLRLDLVSNAYDIGLTLRDIRDRDLWKASGASSLKDFMEKELGISRTSGYRYMALTEEYDRKTFLEIGPRKLSLISGIGDKENREEALAAAKAGASTRDVESLANPNKAKNAPAKESGSESPTPKKSGAEITLLAKVNGKAMTIPFRSAESGRALKKYKEGAYGEFQISDDVVLRIGFKNDKEGNHEGLTVAFVRAE